MSRELVMQLIKKKRALYKAHYALIDAELSAEEELAYALPELEAGFEVKLRDANTNKLSSEAKIKRAHFFGRRYTRSLVPSLCIECFVENNASTSMEETVSELGNGIRKFQCPICNHVLQVHPE